MLKRTISLFLSIMMVLSMMPATAFAAEMEETVPVETVAETTAPETAAPEIVETTVAATAPAEETPDTTVTTEVTIPETQDDAESIPEDTVPGQTTPETLPEEGASEDLEESVTEPAVSDSISTAQTISNGSTVNGYFKNMASLGGGAFNSEDYYRFTLSKRTVVTLWPTASGGNMSVQLLNSSETVLRPSTVTSSYLKITLDPGTYYIFVYNYSDNMSYSLTLEYCVHSATSKTVINPTCTEEGYTRYTCHSCGISWNQDYVRASHTYTWTTIKEPTCTQKGRERGVCRYCSYRTEENITELGHNVSAWATTQEPTCAEAGIESGVCRRCNQTVKKSIEKLPHTYDNGVVTKEPTCSKEGIRTKTCVNCGAKTQVSVAKTAHKIDESRRTLAKAPTATASGKYTSPCSYCGASTTQYINSNASYKETYVIEDGVIAIGDNAFYSNSTVKSIIIPDSVTSIGEWAFYSCKSLTGIRLPNNITRIRDYAFAYCTNLSSITMPANVSVLEDSIFYGCDNLKKIHFTGNAPRAGGEYGRPFGSSVKATAYYPSYNSTWTKAVRDELDYLSDVTWYGCYHIFKNATCTSPSYCSCGAYGDYAAHNYSDATCVTPQTCTECAKTTGKPLGHSFTQYTSNQDATCTQDGTKTAKCDRCSETETITDVGSVLGHATMTLSRVEPTCTDTGLTEGQKCTRCKEVLVAQEVIPALGHDEIIDEYVAPTCLETGLTEGKHCGRCNQVLLAQEVIPELGHAEVTDAAVVPDCTNVGYTEGSHCERCGFVFVAQEVISELGHVEVIDAYLAPTCTEDGITEGKHCSTCGEILIAQEVLPAKGHDYDVGICLTCGHELPSTYQLFAGKSLNIKITNPATNKPYTAKQLVWTLDERFEPFATMKSGKLTAKKVVERARIEIVGTVVATEEVIRYFVDIYPAVTQLEVKQGESVVNGKTVRMDFSEETLTLNADIFPTDVIGTVTWTVSDSKKQYASYEIDGNTLRILNPTGKAGMVTVKATITAGVKKTATVKVSFGSFAKTVQIVKPSKTTIRGGESLQLFAYILEPETVTQPGVVWTVSDKNAATISNGKLTGKNVTHPTVVTVTAASKDGCAGDSVEIEIIPKDEGKLVLMNGEKFVTNGTLSMNYGETSQLTAAVITNGEPVAQSAIWTTTKGAVAYVADGLVTATGVGTAKITAEFNGQKAMINVKVGTLVESMEITTKDGKNLMDENGETMVLVSSGKSVNLVASVNEGANKAVDWAITEGEAYAKISGGKVTANKDLTKPVYITVKATAKDGSGVNASIRVKIVPLATGVQIFESGSRVRSNTTYISDLTTNSRIKLNAKVYPAKANQAVELTSSNKKIAEFIDGELVCYKTGTVTITAKALDGSNAKATFKLTVVKKITSLTLKDNLPLDKNGNLYVAGGKSLKLATMVDINPADATNKKLKWSVPANEYGIKISSSGVLTTKKVTAPVTINVMAMTQDGSGLMLSFNVTIYPA